MFSSLFFDTRVIFWLLNLLAGHCDVVRLLLRHPQVHINEYDRFGRSSLIYATRLDRAELVTLLLDAGIDDSSWVRSITSTSN
jgi:ankyrin repeat protein